MGNTLFTYEEALEQTGSKHLLSKAVADGSIHKLDRGLYSSVAHPDPLAVAHIQYPEGVITMDSALYEYGLTDIMPDEVHIATAREATRIVKPGYRQYFIEGNLLNPGATEVEKPDGTVRLYDKERLLVEVMRRQASIPLDYYKEVIGSYRRIAEELDIRLIEDYIALFKRNDFMFDILQREVL
ncbi:hypothetical protein VJ923_03620 [Adlercreutzia sp. R25]|uniref:Abortive infection protein n=1 Tax=Adlercreutzia shanghongiae TaxID=3111773 RepID=A0ABU6IVX0_9ACTN|nr:MULTISPECIES: hypothetical protein [unclassified Adlercreutzia]MEC4272248.1 hypothetical protein [Adlercreutzia sp. R25]MEC4293976.1 hypothetical protein [Adlercreutzia sp. R22]